MKYIKYCNNRKKKYTNTNNNSSNKCYITTIIFYICLLNIVVNNVSLSNEDIISKQEFQKLLDIKHNITGLKKISETMFELMFNNTNGDYKEEVKHTTTTANDNKEVKSTTVPNDVSMRENKGLGGRTTDGIMGDGGEKEEEQVGKETDNMSEEVICYTELPKDRTIENFAIMFWQLYSIIEKIQSNQSTNFEIISSLVKQLEKINEDNNIFQDRCTTLLNTQVDTLNNLSNVINGLLNAYISKEEIVEIVNKAISSSISSYNETYQQTTEESKLYQTQIIQMLKDLTNKVDRLESISQKKEMTEKATQSTIQTFTNGLCSSEVI